MGKITGYSLSKEWFNWSFENPEKIKPSHGILYFFIIEHCNRLGWKEKFGLPTTMAKEAIGIRSYNTYINTLNDLVEWGFITMIEKSKNQYSSNIVAISNFNKAHDKALDKALIKHGSKQRESTSESISSIDKQLTTNQDIPAFLDFKTYALENKPNVDVNALELKYKAWIANNWINGNGKKIKNWKTSLLNTLPHIQENKNSKVTIR